MLNFLPIVVGLQANDTINYLITPPKRTFHVKLPWTVFETNPNLFCFISNDKRDKKSADFVLSKMTNVMYFDQLSGAAHTQKLVDNLTSCFWPYSTIFVDFRSFSVIFLKQPLDKKSADFVLSKVTKIINGKQI